MTTYAQQPGQTDWNAQVAFQLQRQAILDDEHLRLLAIGYYVLGGLMFLYGLFGLLYVFMGIMVAHAPTMFAPSHAAAQPGVPAATPPDPRVFADIMSMVGGGILIVAWVFAALTMAAGRCIANRTGYVFSMVVAGIQCVMVPIGTILGVATFAVLTRESVKYLYGLPSNYSPPATTSQA